MFFKVYGFDIPGRPKSSDIPKSQDIITLDMENMEKHIIEELELDLDGNILINGVTRYGKSVFAEAIAGKVEEMDRADMRVYFDVKNDYINKFGRPDDKVVSFRDNLGDYNYFKWNLVKEVRDAEDSEFEIKEIVNMLLADRMQGSEDDFFYKGAAKIFEGYVTSIIHTYKNNPDNRLLIHNLKTDSSVTFIKTEKSVLA